MSHFRLTRRPFRGVNDPLVVGLLGLLPIVATAQSQDASSTTSALETIVVTAQKREQSLQEVPISISVVSGEAIASGSIKGFEDLDESVPNLFIARSPGADAIFIRGIGSGAGSPSLDQSVVMFVDGVYAGRSRQFQTPFLDVERIEVLRGPQGALVGKNTSAGAINIVTARPTDTFEGFVSAEYDFELEGTTLNGVVSGPLSDRFSMRLAAKYQDLDGYIRNVMNNQDEPSREGSAVRLTGMYSGDALTITAKVEHTELDVSGNPYVMTTQLLGRKLDRTKESGSSLGGDFDNNETNNATLTIDYEFGGHTFTSITGYSEYKTRHSTDADFFEADLAYSNFDEDYEQVSQEFRLLSPTGQTIEYVVGVYWHDADLTEWRGTASFFAPAASTFRTFVQDNRALSGYAQVTWNITDDFRIAVNGRYTKEKKEARYVRIGGPLAFTERQGALQADISDKLDEDEFDPAVTLQWDVTPNLMVFASYGQGSKSGGFQGAIPNATAAQFQFAPETSESYEVGMKSVFSRGYFDLTVFDTTYDDLQVSSAIQSDPNVSVFAFFTGNAASASARGAEASAVIRATDSLLINASLAYISAKFDSYPHGPCATGQAPDDPVRGSCNLTGVRLPFASKWSGSLSLTYSRDLTDRLAFTTTATANFRTDFRAEFPNDPMFVQDDYVKYDLRVGFKWDDRIEVALLGRNLTDEYTFGFGGTGNLATNPVFGLAPDARMLPLDLPRTIALQARYNF